MGIKIEKSQEEQLDDQADETGQLVHKAVEAVEELYHAIDFGPGLDTEGERAFVQLNHVRSLLQVAAALYPYPFGENRE